MNNAEIVLRPYEVGDCSPMAQLFYNTVHSVNKSDYSQEQLDAWASGIIDFNAWHEKFSSSVTIIAECQGVLRGFANRAARGEIDFLYVHKDYQRQGIGSIMLRFLEMQRHGELPWAFVSLTARPFFESRGYAVLRENRVLRKGVVLKNYLMKKSPLSPPAL